MGRTPNLSPEEYAIAVAQAEIMRKYKAAKNEPRERALHDAIKAEIGAFQLNDGAHDGAWKMAKAIESPVNARIAKEGHAPYKVDAIMRQIRKVCSPHS